MTREEAQARIDEIKRPFTIFKPSEVPVGYQLVNKQPTMPTMSEYKLYSPVYTEQEIAELKVLRQVVEQ